MARWSSKLSKSILKSHHVKLSRYDMPIRLRPWFLAFTCLIMIILAFLGFTNFSRSLPLNDKLLHFICFAIATGVFYWIIDVEEQARRIWFWKYSSLIFTTFTCFFCGGILSEFVQAALPYKEFDMGDVVANLLGSSLGLSASFQLEKYYRRRRELSRLYRPLNADYSDEEDDVFSAGTVLLPTHVGPHKVNSNSKDATSKQKQKQQKNVRFADEPYDEGERQELFDIGQDSDSDVDEESGRAGPSTNSKAVKPATVSTADTDNENGKTPIQPEP